MSYLVSIGIATRNRQFFAEKTIKQVYALGETVQIVVSDNSDDDSLRTMIGEILDQDRIKYIYTPQRISVVENYDLTAQNADGAFYLCIGDDDLVLEQVTELAAWMDKCKVDAVRSSRGVTYIWPGATSRFGRVAVEKITGECHRFSALDGVIQVLKQGCQGYIETDMAGSYHALVRMSKMREVQEKTGFFFSGFSPDIYSATCLSLLPDIRCAAVDFPVSIPGSCASSATNRGAKGSAVSRVDDAIKRVGKEGYQWEKQNIFYYTPETTWADSMIKATRLMGREDLLNLYFNKAALVNEIYRIWGNVVPEIRELLKKEETVQCKTRQPGPDYWQWRKWNRIKRRLNGDVRDMFFVSDNMQAYSRIERFLNSGKRKTDWNKIMERTSL